MFLSSRRAIVATCAAMVFLISVAITYEVAMRFNFKSTLPLLANNQFSTSQLPNNQSGVNRPTVMIPNWTTEQLIPRFAYVQYATDIDYLCNTIINFSLLKRYGTAYDLVLIYPITWDDKMKAPHEFAAITAIHVTYPYLVLRPFKVLSTSHGDATWRDSLTKFHAFALTEYTRVLAFDSDSLVLNSMDHYFLAPLSPISVPRAYWLNEKDASLKNQILGSHVMLLEPNKGRYKKIVEVALKSGDFDMEVINYLFSDSAMILPHRRLALLTGEFRSTDHRKYFAGEEDEEWNAMAEVSRAYLVHFSDWPLPKPWKPRTQEQWKSALPVCGPDDVERPDRPKCADQVMWTGFYEDYDRYKEERCAILAM